ncbi:MAG: hypoxanthine phosphoribosyltransferase [Lachnospiraceae bacterium]|nr:hypoxanthine phosphoribosyltransferase [Lachnospiraceae bacterium]
MADKISVMITADEIEKKVCELGAQISRDYAGKCVHLICVLKGSMFFTCELAKRITIPVTIDTMSVSSYGAGTESTGRVRIVKDLDEPVQDRDVLIVEDIIDSGNTLFYLMNLLGARAPKSLKLCTLLDKPERRVTSVKVDYCGFEIPDKFVVGYGLDYAQKYRNLPFIGVVEELDPEG